MKLASFKLLRIAILLFILLSVWQYTQNQQKYTQSWNNTLDVIIYPINADEHPETRTKTESYTSKLDERYFSSIDKFLSKQAQTYQSWLNQPTKIRVDKSIIEPPPLPPKNSDTLSIMWWSLKFRWWAFINKPDNDDISQIRIYVLYHTPQHNIALPHSTGLQKGLIGIVHAFADASQANQNNIIIAHELLHTLGATDKYNLLSNQPIYPDGFAEPNRNHKYPQHYAEIMAGRIPISETQADIPTSLTKVKVGKLTAKEIGWIN